MTRVRWFVLALALWACGDEASGGAGGAGAAGGTGAAVAGGAGTDVGFASTVMPLVDSTCNCHQSEPILMAPFSLKAGEAYDNLVGQPAMQLASMALVAPGSLNDSYLWHKLNGTQLEVGGSGERMPSTIPLDAAQIEVFGRWIAAGAPR